MAMTGPWVAFVKDLQLENADLGILKLTLGHGFDLFAVSNDSAEILHSWIKMSESYLLYMGSIRFQILTFQLCTQNIRGWGVEAFPFLL